MIHEWFVSHTLHVYTTLHLQMLFYMIYLMTYQWSVSHTLHAYTTRVVMIYEWSISHTPLTEEIRPQIFGSPDLTVFLLDLLSDGDSVYTRENVYENCGIPVKTCLICTGTPVKTCWKIWESWWFEVQSRPSVDRCDSFLWLFTSI